MRPSPRLALAALLALLVLAAACDDPEPQSGNNGAWNNGGTNNGGDNNGDGDAGNNGNNANNTPTDTDNNGNNSNNGDDADLTDPGNNGQPDADADTHIEPMDVDPDLPDIPDMTGASATYNALGETATVTVVSENDGYRTWQLTTTQPLRDDNPPGRRVDLAEQRGQMILRSGNLVLDGLFALAMEETRQNSVSSISDGAFNNGAGVPCDCFETGRNWKYVWTRDTAYSVDLGLAFVDPVRAMNSMNFKLSERKGGGDLQIVQDTGSGGSWPVSTDRVVWAIGARELLAFLPEPHRTAFRDRAFDAATHTIAQDRDAVWDERDGLYRGEQSFLDWREQSYPAWTADNTVHLAMGKSLSTNVGHLALLRLAEDLAREKADNSAAQRYDAWATQLAASIDRELWDPELGAFAAMKGTELDPAVLQRYDLLGLDLAILHDLAGPQRGRAILADYPHTPMGPPVIWPQQPRVPIYHNRGIWPFVTAYTVLAAAHVDEPAVFDHDLESLIRGAALNLSNMENFDFLSQRPWVDDGAYSGPVVNSQRQLWSVAGFLGAFVKGVVGLHATEAGLAFDPYVTAHLRNTALADTDTLVLANLPYKGKIVTALVHLPPADATALSGRLPVTSVHLDGRPVTGPTPASALSAESLFEITLGPAAAPPGTVRIVTDNGDFRRFWGPVEPDLQGITLAGDRLRLSWTSSDTGVTYNVYRNGDRVAEGLTDTSWTDAGSASWASQTFCYAVEAVFTVSGNPSHHSPPRCYWGEGDGSRVRDLSVYTFRQLQGGSWAETAGSHHYADWGAPADALAVGPFRPDWTGLHNLQLRYGNGAGGINTGITAGVKRVTVHDLTANNTAAEGLIVMPQLARWDRWADSSFLQVNLDATHRYRILIEDGVNMSYFAHFQPYTGGNGGGGSPSNDVNISHVRLLPMAGAAAPATPTITFDGAGDLDAIRPARRLTPGARLQTWEQFGVDWDDHYLYIALTSQAFESAYVPFHLYLEAASGALGAATPGTGLEYSNLTPQLPFTPTHLITARNLSDDGSAGGPWNGLFVREAGSLQRLRRFEPGVDGWLAADQHALSLRIPRANLGDPTRLRLAAHVVNAVPANEWKDTVPDSHTPWATSAAGFLEINLDTGTIDVR